MSEMRRVPNVDLRPTGEIVGEEERTKWVYVRLIQKPDGKFLSLEATEALLIGGVGIVPGACVATSRAELDAVIAALVRMRDRLPE